MELYELLADYYDDLFPLEDNILQLLLGEFPAGSTLLDLGCGTGTYAIALSRHGRIVTGLDLDGRMIRLAAEKTTEVIFREGDMSAPAAESHFDGLYCIGNTLVHLEDQEAILRALHNWHDILAPGGAMAVQIVNYDRIIDSDVRELPTLVGERASLVRRYQNVTDSSISFVTELLLPDNDTRLEESTRLVPLRMETLRKMLEEVGFQELEVLGSYSGDPYGPSSFLTIFVGKKPAI